MIIKNKRFTRSARRHKEISNLSGVFPICRIKKAMKRSDK